jgi:hypothetical protein
VRRDGDDCCQMRDADVVRHEDDDDDAHGKDTLQLRLQRRRPLQGSRSGRMGMGQRMRRTVLPET